MNNFYLLGMSGLVLTLALFFPVKLSSQVILGADELKLSSLQEKLYRLSSGEQAEIKLPNHEGHFRTYVATESNILAAEFKSRRPDYKSFRIVDKDNPRIRGRMAISQFGIHAIIITPFGTIYIEGKDGVDSDEYYIYLNDNPLDEEAQEQPRPGCLGAEKAPEYREPMRRFNFRNNDIIEHGDEIAKYNLAIVTTAYFYENNGSSIPMAETVVMNSVNSIQAIYEVDVAVQFNLLQPFIYTNTSTHPFPGNNLPKEAADAVDANFSISEYDIGHVFHNSSNNASIGGGGVAGLGVVCKNFAWQGGPGRAKAAGWSGSFSNTSNGWIQLAAHEFGHMFDATHTFNGEGGACTSGPFNGNTNYEIGSGSTIMSYQGICGTGQNIPSSGVADNYFHANSIDRMINYILNDGTCATDSITGNTPPEADADPCGNVNMIPLSTPFKIVGEAFDADGDVLTYSWEQYDNDGPSGPTKGKIGSAAASDPLAPLFRSFPPANSPIRYFPNVNLILANNFDSSFEPLPTVERSLTFRLTVRDGVGGLGMDEMTISVEDDGPFQLTFPDGGQTFNAGDNTTVTWDVNGTDSFCDDVNISLSVDGGQTYPYLLAEEELNNGSFTVEIPDNVPNTTQARIKVACADNPCVVFFSISEDDFEIDSDCEVISSRICPTDPVSANSGDLDLDLDMDAFPGFIRSARIFETTTGSPTYSSTSEADGGGCKDWGFTTAYDIMEFAVTDSGNYTFTIDGFGGGGSFRISNVFEESFDSNDPCDTWIASSAAETSGGGVSGFGSYSVELASCKTYFITLARYFGTDPFSNEISFSGPGDVIEVVPIPSDYNYTFVAVNNATDEVDAVSSDADFTALGNGDYCVYGVMYKESGTTPPDNVDPNDFIGETLADLLASGDCLLPSNECRSMEILSSGICDASFAYGGVQSLDNPPFNSIEFCSDDANPVPVISGNSGGAFTANSMDISLNSSTGEIDLSSSLTGIYVVTYEDTTSGGCEESIEVIILENPTATAGNDGPYCEGETINLTASGGVSYSWEGPDGFSSTDQNPTLMNATVSMDGNYTVTVTDSNGCTDEASTSVDVNASPTASAGNDGPYCEGETINLTASGGVSYFWEGPDGFSSLDQNPTLMNATVSMDGNYTVTVTDSNGCTDEASTSVDVDASPTASAGNDGPYCEGETINLTGSGGVSYSWEGPDGFSSTDQNPTLINATVSMDGNYTVTVTDSNGCMDEASTSVDVDASPTASAGNDGPYCEGETINLTGSGGVSYSWAGPDGFSSTDQNPTLMNATVSMDGSYTVTVTDTNGCTDQASTLVEVNGQPQAPGLTLDCSLGAGNAIVIVTSPIGAEFEYALDGGTYQSTVEFTGLDNGNYTVVAKNTNTDCVSDVTDITVNCGCIDDPTVILSSTSAAVCGLTAFNLQNNTFGGSATEVNLSHNGSGTLNSMVFSSSPFDFTYTPDPADLGTTVTITAETDNPLGLPCVSAVATFELTVNSLQTATAGNDGPYCEGETINLTASGGVSYSWEGPDGYSSTDQNPTLVNATVSMDGNYSVTVTDSNGCTDEASTSVDVNASPNATAGNTGPYCPGDDILLNSSGGNSYSWGGPDGFASSSQNSVIPDAAAVNSGTYFVTVTDSNGCTDVAQTTVTVEDDEVPQINCPSDVTVSIPVGNTEGFVNLPDATATDNCGVDEITNDYNAGGADASDFYNLGSTTVEFTATDVGGNTSTCTTEVTVIEDVSTVSVSGVFERGNGEPLPGVVVNYSGDESGVMSTDSAGFYQFTVDGGSGIEVEAERNTSWVEFVSTLDLINIQRHILLIELLDSPYKIIAADANGDDNLTTFDLILLQRIIIGMQDSIAGNKSWRFVPADYVFTDPTDPLSEDFPEVMEYDSLLSDQTDQDWVAIKVGDVTWPSSGIRTANEPKAVFYTSSPTQDNSGLQSIAIHAGKTDTWSKGYQFELHFDPNHTQIRDIQFDNASLPNLSENNFLVDNESGVLRANWYFGPGFWIEADSELFKLEFSTSRARSAFADLFEISPPGSRLNAEFYMNSKHSSRLLIQPLLTDREKTVLSHGVVPNPWSSTAELEFELSESVEAEIEVFTPDGRLVRTFTVAGHKGSNRFALDEQIPSGFLIYSINAGDQTVFGNMIRME